MMKKILFVAEAVTLAHVCRLYVLADAARSLNCEIYFACDERMKAMFDFSKFKYLPIRSISSENFLDRIETGQRLFLYPELLDYSKQELSLFSEIKPDLVVGDLRVSLAVSSRVAEIPYWLLTNAYWSLYAKDSSLPVPEIRGKALASSFLASHLIRLIQPLVLRFHLGAINKLCKFYRLPKFRSFPESFSFSDRTLYADIPEIAPCIQLPSSHRYIGQVKWSADVPLPDWYSRLDFKRRSVFINLGSSGPASLLGEIVGALKGQDLQLIVATAGRARLEDPSIFWADYLPAEMMTKLSDLVICNGGSPSSYLALSSGVPMIGIPSNLDQLLNMRNMARLKTGIMIRSSEFSQEKLLASVSEILRVDIYKKNAMRVADALSRYNACENFKRELKDFLKVEEALPPQENLVNFS